MVQAGPGTSPLDPHDEAELLLPWYAMGQLDEADRARFEDHLYSCATCREQLSLERRVAGEFQTMTPELESGWARLRARIGSAEGVRVAQARRPSEFWALLTRPAVASLAAAQLAFVILAAAILLSLGRPVYHTLGSAPPPPSANIIVVFNADASEEDVRDALKAANASIVGGPTSADAYLLHVVGGDRQAAIAKLQSNGNVEMAEPIDGDTP